jgi:hypothetical protein
LVRGDDLAPRTPSGGLHTGDVPVGLQAQALEAHAHNVHCVGASGIILDRSQNHMAINALGRVSFVTVEVPVGRARQSTFQRFGRDVEGYSLQGQSTLEHELFHDSSSFMIPPCTEPDDHVA